MIWQQVTVGEFLKNREERFKPSDKQIKNLRRIDKIDFSGQLFLSNKPSNTDMILVRKNDLVISGINVEKGAMCIYNGDEDISATIHYSSYEINKEKIDVDFLKLFLISPEFKDAIKEQVPGGIKTEIKPKHILPLKIVIPKTLAEQTKIVEQFKSVEDKVLEATSEFASQLNFINKLRQQFLQDVIQGKLVPQDTNDEPASVLLEKIKVEKEKLIKEKKLKKSKPLPPIKEEEIPYATSNELKLCRLGEICKVEKGNLGITKAIPGKYPLVALSEERLSHNEFQFDCRGVIVPLISSTGHGHASMKRIHFQEGKFSVGSILCCIFPFMNGVLNEKFLYHYLDNFKEEFFVKKMKGAANVSLKVSSIEETPIPLIPVRAQNKFEEIMQTLEEFERTINNNVLIVEQLLQSALKEALEPKVN